MLSPAPRTVSAHARSTHQLTAGRVGPSLAGSRAPAPPPVDSHQSTRPSEKDTGFPGGGDGCSRRSFPFGEKSCSRRPLTSVTTMFESPDRSTSSPMTSPGPSPRRPQRARTAPVLSRVVKTCGRRWSGTKVSVPCPVNATVRRPRGGISSSASVKMTCCRFGKATEASTKGAAGGVAVLLSPAQPSPANRSAASRPPRDCGGPTLGLARSRVQPLGRTCRVMPAPVRRSVPGLG